MVYLLLSSYRINSNDKMILNTKQKERLQSAIQSGSFNLEVEVENLISQGHSKEEAIAYIKAEIDIYKQQLFEEKLKKENQHEYQKIAGGVALAVSILGPVFEITS